MSANDASDFLSGIGNAASSGMYDHKIFDYHVTKTCTYEKCDGVSNPMIYYDRSTRMLANNLGLPNPGISYYENDKPDIIPKVLSIHPDCLYYDYDFSKLPSHIRTLEINVSCPNTSYGMVGYNLYMLGQVLKMARKLPFRIGVKLPYYADRTFAEKVGHMCKHAGVYYVVCCNSLTGYVSTTTCGVTCGVTSPYFKTLVLANCKWFADICGLRVIGCGGIRSRDDVAEYRKVGCYGVQISSPSSLKAKL